MPTEDLLVSEQQIHCPSLPKTKKNLVQWLRNTLQDLEMGDMSLEVLTAMADPMGPISDLPPGWSMDLDEKDPQ